MKQLEKYSTRLDKFIAYASSEAGAVELSKKEREQWDRINYAENLIHKDWTDREIVNALSKKYTDSATGKKLYSERTFYSDINDARVVFGACAVHNKAHDRKWLMERHKKTHRLLLEAEAWDALVRLEQQMYKTAGLNVVDDLNIDPADFGNHNYYMIISGATNNNLQINLNSAAQIPDAEKEIIIEQLNNHFDAQQSKLLEGFLKKKKPEDGK